jgi:hypothetical protein
MGQSTAAARAAFGREVVSFVAVGRTNPGSRQPERAGFSEMPKKRAKKKTFSAVKAVKANARERVGQPKPERVIPNTSRETKRGQKHPKTLTDLLQEDH